MKSEFRFLMAAIGVTAVTLFPWDMLVEGLITLDPRLRLHATLFGGVWIWVRVSACFKARARWRAWRLPASWQMEAFDLPFESNRGRNAGLLGQGVYHWLSGNPTAGYSREFAVRISEGLCHGQPAFWFRPLLRWLGRRLYPDDGILLGRAFRWSPEHTRELETHLHSGKSLPVGRDVRGGYPALHAVGMKEEQPLVVPWSELVGHVLIGGTTRSGKTRLLEVILCEAIRGPGTVIIIDPKGDAELLIRAATEAHRAGRQFAFFGPAFPAVSASFNPLSMCTSTTELAARVQALMPGGGGMSKGDPFFTEYPLAVIEKIGAAQHAVGDKWTIAGLNAATTLVPPFEDLVARYLYLKVLGNKNKDVPGLEDLKAEYAAKRGTKQDLLADALLDDQEKPREHFVQVTANLVPAFRGVTGGKMDRLLSSDKPQLTWKGVVEERKVVYFAMSSLMYGEVANRIGRVILQDLIGFLGRRYAFEDPATMTPLTILIDEFSNVAYPGFIDALNKGGGARANIMLAMQSLADPEASMGKDGTQRVLDNLNTRIWFRLTDDATAKLAIEGLGMTSVGREEISHSLSFGGSSGTSAGSRGAMQYVDRSLVRPEWVTGLPRGEAFVRTRGENWKLRVPLLTPVSKREVEEVAARYGLEKVLTEFEDQAGQTDGERAEETTGSLEKAPQRQSGKDSRRKETVGGASAGQDLIEFVEGRNGSPAGPAEDSGKAEACEQPQASSEREPATALVEEETGDNDGIRLDPADGQTAREAPATAEAGADKESGNTGQSGTPTGISTEEEELIDALVNG